MKGDMKGKRVLIVEDEQILAITIRAVLEESGMLIAGIVKSGEEAVEQAIEGRVDLVLMDIKLSGLIDGIEAAGLISRSYEVPIIYMSGNTDRVTLERARQSGYPRVLSKPVEDAELINEIRCVFNCSTI